MAQHDEDEDGQGFDPSKPNQTHFTEVDGRPTGVFKPSRTVRVDRPVAIIDDTDDTRAIGGHSPDLGEDMNVLEHIDMNVLENVQLIAEGAGQLNQFSCDHCDRFFNSHRELEEHEESIHEQELEPGRSRH